MKVISSNTYKLHNALELSRGKLAASTESPQHADIIVSALENAGFALNTPDELDLQLIRRVHNPEYVNFLMTAWSRWKERYDTSAAIAFTWPSRGTQPARPTDLVGQLGYHSFSADSSIGQGTWEAVCAAAAIAQTAADSLTLEKSTAYALCRPPGHHATKDQFGGYCFLNNSAIAAQRLRDNGHARVAVLDIDYHHGNGTQDIFYAREDVLTVSIHADPAEEFPWFSGYACETGEGTGKDCNVNLPLARNSSVKNWYQALAIAVERVRESSASALVIALGVDTYIDDPLGTFKLTTQDYKEVASLIAAINVPTVIVQEGGYAVGDIGNNVVAFLQSFK